MTFQNQINFLPQADLQAQSASEAKSMDVNPQISTNPEQINDETGISKSRVSTAMRTEIKRRRKNNPSTAVDSTDIEQQTKRTIKSRAAKTVKEDDMKRQQLCDEIVSRKRKTKV